MMDNRVVVAVLSLACWAGAGAGAFSAPDPVREVRMLETRPGVYAFEPAELTIRVGQRVRWINVSGGPHNVAFDPGRIPPGAREPLGRAMPERLGDQELAGRLLFDDGETYEMSFAGLPLGAYHYVCTPHEMAGMSATIVVVR